MEDKRPETQIDTPEAKAYIAARNAASEFYYQNAVKRRGERW